MSTRAFVLRISPSGIDRVPEALSENCIIIGWSDAAGLLDANLDWWQFREIISQAVYPTETNARRAGAAAGQMWRFVREMDEGSLVVVPSGSSFYVAKVVGPATFDPTKQSTDSSYRRPVEWLNDAKPIPRSLARSALISRMKTQGTCADASDLRSEIEECVVLAGAGQSRTFNGDLQERLVRETLSEIRSGRMESFAFEKLIETVFRGLGAADTWIVPRSLDKGVDIYAVFRVAGIFRQLVAIQAKHWQPEPPVGAGVVQQLINGIEAGEEQAAFGMVITSGTIGADAQVAADEYSTRTGVPIELIDGDQFARLIVENGIRESG